MKKQIRTTISLTIIITIIISTIFYVPIPVMAETYFLGNGTVENPYMISNANQLSKLSELIELDNSYPLSFRDKYYRLQNDIDISVIGSWIPISKDDAHSFYGQFDGNGFSISGISISAIDDPTKSESYALFGYNHGTIKNLGLENGSISLIKTTPEFYPGAPDDLVAGIVAINRGTIVNCFNSCNITGVSNAGGIVSQQLGQVIKCYNSGIVTATGYYNANPLVSSPGYSGGISADNSGTASSIIKCYNSGSIHGTHVGGISRNNSSTISDCYNVGEIAADKAMPSQLTESGGIVSLSIGKILNCYNVGSINNSNVTGGITARNFIAVGYDNEISNCYYLNTSVKGTANGIGVSCSQAQLQDESTFIGFDFGAVWEMPTTYSENNHYPVLIGVGVIPQSSDTLDHISITQPADKTTYLIGDELDITGLEVTATYSNNYAKIMDVNQSNITGFDSSVALVNQILTITIEDKTTTYNVKILPTYNRLLIREDNSGIYHSYDSFFDIDACEAPVYYLSDYYYNKLVQNANQGTKDLILSEIQAEWHGSCQGISSAMALSKSNYISYWQFDTNAIDFFHLSLPRDNHNVRDLINYYQLAQNIPAIRDAEIYSYRPSYNLFGSINMHDVLSNIVSKVKNIDNAGDTLLITTGWLEENEEGKFEYAGHCLVGNHYELLPSGDHRIEIVDPNYRYKYIYLTIDSNYNSFKYTYFDDAGVEQILHRYTDTWVKIGYIELSSLNSIDIDGECTYTTSSSGEKIYISNYSSFNISNGLGNVLYSSSQGISGDLKLNDFKIINQATESTPGSGEIMFGFDQVGSYTISPSDGCIKVSSVTNDNLTSVNTTCVSSIELMSDHSLKINGQNCNYDVVLSNPNEVGIIQISDSNGADVNISKELGGIVVSNSNTIDNMQIQIITGPNSEKYQITITSDKSELLIKDKPNDDSGSAQIYTSLNNNGDFGILLGETIAIDSYAEPDEVAPEIVCSIENDLVNDYCILPLGTIIEFSGSDQDNDIPASICAVLYSGDVKNAVNSGFSPLPGVYQLQIMATDNAGNATEKTVRFIISAKWLQQTVTDVTVTYQSHVQDIGWQGWKNNGTSSGTTGQSKRLEAMNIKLENLTGGIEYRSHVQDIGWMDWVADGNLSGTTGQSKRLEAIQIRLTGNAAEQYDVYYRVHVQNKGWLDWAKNGESAGSAGYSYRMEAIQIMLVPKGGTAPGLTVHPFTQSK